MIMLSFVELLKQPWFAVSPSPWSLAFYVLMGVIGARIILSRGVKYKRAPWLISFLDAVFLLGVIVFIQDSIWLIVNSWRWILPLYSGTATFWNYWIRFPQNIVGALLLFLLTSGFWLQKIVRFNKRTVFWFSMIALSTFLVFALAPNQAWTDWVFAVSHRYSDQVILESFLISHVGYKLLIALAFLSLFHDGVRLSYNKIEESSIAFKNRNNNIAEQIGG